MPGLRWTPQENLHITVYFFAEVSEELQPNLESLLQLALNTVPVFELAFDRYELAPPGQKAPRMIWARFQKQPEFLRLHQNIHSLYSQIHPKQQIRKRPIPHVTLARLKGKSQNGTWKLEGYPQEKTLRVEKLILWESQLKPEGAAYANLKEYPLLQK